MVAINTPAFAEEIARSLKGEKTFNQRELDKTLCFEVEGCQSSLFHPELPGSSAFDQVGIAFNYTGELVLLLLKRSYDSLRRENADAVTPASFASAIAGALERFAEPFPSDEYTGCYPHFLLHGLMQPSLEGVVRKIEDNARTIHETRAVQEDFIDTHRPFSVGQGLAVGFSNGTTDDCFGITGALFPEELFPSGYVDYIAKFGFFLDTTHKEVCGLNLQGPYALHLFQNELWVRDASGKKVRSKEGKERGRAYARLTAKLGKDPRVLLIEKVKEILREEGYQKLRVVRPSEHPMSIEQHEGFHGKYEPILRQAGLVEEDSLYLSCNL